MSFPKHPLTYILVPLCVLVIAASFYTFIVSNDYIVEYEGMCDPATNSCFSACEDEECTAVYYHSWVQKQNSDVYAECGPDITDCDAAGVCLPTDQNCSIKYCDAAVDVCVGPGLILPDEEEGPTEEEPVEEEINI